MSVFKTKSIILKISKVKEKDFIFDLFTYDFGKIKVQKKDSRKEKNLDLGYIINCEIETKENRNIHKIKNIKINSEFDYENKNFGIINSYLEIISFIEKNIPEGVEFKEIFEIIEKINSKKNIDEIKLILAKLKIKNLFGELDLENENIKIKKILKFINNNKIKDILKLTGIDEELKEKLEKIVNN